MAEILKRGMEHIKTPWLAVWAVVIVLYALYSAIPYVKCLAYFGLKGVFDSMAMADEYKKEAASWNRTYKKRIKRLVLFIMAFTGYVFLMGLK